MSGTEIKAGVDNIESLLTAKAKELVSVLEQGDLSTGLNLITELQEVRHNAFYNEIGHMTRGLHEAIKTFSEEVGGSSVCDDERDKITSITDASERLNYVIELTEKTAHDTMDRVDKSLSLVDRLDDQSARFKELLSLVGQLEGEFEGLRGVYDRTCKLKGESEETIEELRSQLTEILVSQGFQDITGQLIRRVITLVTHIENQLVSLMEMAAKVEKLSGIEAMSVESGSESEKQETAKVDAIAAEGPQLAKAKESGGVARDQDDVDELLSSLGF